VEGEENRSSNFDWDPDPPSWIADKLDYWIWKLRLIHALDRIGIRVPYRISEKAFIYAVCGHSWRIDEAARRREIRIRITELRRRARRIRACGRASRRAPVHTKEKLTSAL
jgi:hypothetical protein